MSDNVLQVRPIPTSSQALQPWDERPVASPPRPPLERPFAAIRRSTFLIVAVLLLTGRADLGHWPPAAEWESLGAGRALPCAGSSVTAAYSSVPPLCSRTFVSAMVRCATYDVGSDFARNIL